MGDLQSMFPVHSLFLVQLRQPSGLLDRLRMAAINMRILSAKNVKGIALTKQSVLEGIILSQIQDKSKTDAAAKVAGRLSGS